ncbi:MAG: nitroreductase family protein [Candidatus Bathyarchaeota archaeon]|nr:nitroreductase family protein [Candidatus Bathyarchaeota archaeon]MDH5787969.1 nitroreductase family protein [Candidatus Bathyarchaeota archaeon]
MKLDPIIKIMLEHKSIRKYKDEMPSDEVVETIVRAGQQAPFASQAYSVLLSRKRERNPFKSPLLFTICVDYHKFELIMAKRGWKPVTNDITLLFFGIQDAALMAENMVIAGRSLGLGSCFLGSAMYRADKIAEEYRVPKRVFPLVQLAMGYPAEDPPPRPRYPREFTLFEDYYPELDGETITKAMKVMDEGYLAQDYYRNMNAKIPIEAKDREETYTYDNYSWTEHICRKWGQWYPEPKELLEQLEKRGFHITRKEQK